MRHRFTGPSVRITRSGRKSQLRALLDGGTGERHTADCVGADAEAHDSPTSVDMVILHPRQTILASMARPESLPSTEIITRT